MSALQWALLVLGAVAVIAIYVLSRRGDHLPRQWTADGSPGARAPKLPAQNQMDMFESRSVTGDFDEFGVGKPRRVEPGLTLAPGETAPLFAEPASRAPPAAEPPKVLEEKLINLLIAERQGTLIAGSRIHQALAAQHLKFGDRRIYHRLSGRAVVFSVASLLKPGTLDPEQQQNFATPGLTVFMVLPNGVNPHAATENLIATTRALAEQLNAEVFDASRQVFTAEAQRLLLVDVEAWAKRSGL